LQDFRRPHAGTKTRHSASKKHDRAAKMRGKFLGQVVDYEKIADWDTDIPKNH
jgi:hypothetical protein